jgi:hypothetical protein
MGFIAAMRGFFHQTTKEKEDAMGKKIMTGILCALLAMSFGIGDARADDKNLIIATATTGGTYYPVGVAMGPTTPWAWPSAP